MTFSAKENFGSSVAPVLDDDNGPKENATVINNFLAPTMVVFARKERRISLFVKKHRRPIAAAVVGLLLSLVVLVALLLMLTLKSTSPESSTTTVSSQDSGSAENFDTAASSTSDYGYDYANWNPPEATTPHQLTNKDAGVVKTTTTATTPTLLDWQDGAAADGGNFRFRWAPHCDFTGNDMASIKGMSGIENCANECALIDRCMHFTWTKDGDSGICWLKKGGEKYEETAFYMERNGAVCGYLTNRTDASPLATDLTECQQFASDQLEEWCKCREEKGRKTLWLHESCLILDVHRKNYTLAKFACTDKDGGHLAHPKSMGDVDFLVQHGLISDIADIENTVFVGIEQIDGEEPLGGWYYTHYDKNQSQVVDGAVVMNFTAADNLWTFFKNIQEPNDYLHAGGHHEDVGSVFVKGLNDSPETEMRPFICQYS